MSTLAPEHRAGAWRIYVFPVVVVILTAILSALFFLSTRFILTRAMEERLQSLAALGASQIPPDAAENLSGENQPSPAILESTAGRLRAMRGSMENVTHVFILGYAHDPGRLRLLVTAEPQGNDASGTVLPGSRVESYSRELFPAIGPGTLSSAAAGPTAFHAQHGAAVAGFAPLADTRGNPVAILVIERAEGTLFLTAYTLFALGILFLGGWLTVRLSLFLNRRFQQDLEHGIDAERSTLLELTSHQLGAPLATFRWWLEMLQDPAMQSIAQDKESVAEVSQAIERMDGIMRSLTDAGKAEGVFQYQPEVLYSLQNIVQRVVDEVALRLKREQKTIVVRLERRQMPVMVDSKLLVGVLQELVDNALTYSPSGKKVEIRVTLQEQENMVRVEVVDEGCGIPQQDIPRLFQKFSRAGNATQMKPIGNGLGLYVIKNIIERTGGRVGIQSEENKGTTVWFTLPLVQGIRDPELLKPDHTR